MHTQEQYSKAWDKFFAKKEKEQLVMKNRARYWIDNEDQPMTIWKWENGQAFLAVRNSLFEPEIHIQLATIERMDDKREIPRREAVSLFPEAFK